MKANFVHIKAILAIAVAVGFAQANAQGKYPDRLTVPDNSDRTAYSRIDEHGIVRALYNISSSPMQGDAEYIARQFLTQNANVLKLDSGPNPLQLDRVHQTPGATHVRFLQHVNNIPVYRGDVTVSLNTDNAVAMIINNSRQNTDIHTTTPSLSSTQAIEAARSELGLDALPIGKDDEARLMIFHNDDDLPLLAYRITMTRQSPPADWEVFIDAVSGILLRAEDVFALYHQGQGNVYLSDPLSCARMMYNSPGFADNDDADSDSLTRHLSLVTLDSLTYENGVYKLAGPFCSVADIESPADPEYASASPDGFMFSRNHQGFEAVNAYYHVSKSYQYIVALGFSIPSLAQIRIDPHGYQGQDNSHYSPSGNWIAFGEGGVDDAEDADVILHEYGHAIQYNANPFWGGGESGALGEGFGDYWAASYSRSLNQWTSASYHYNWIFNWDGHNPFWAGRILNDQRVYPFGSVPIHSAGQIWSSALMGIWGDLGKTVTDRLVLQSMNYLGSGTTATDNAQAILQADRDLYGGAHLASLEYWLGTVKRFIDITSADVAESHAAEFSLEQNYPNPFNPTTTISFSLIRGGEVSLKIFDVLGQEITNLVQGELPAGKHSVVVEANGIPTGTYFYTLRTASGVQTRKMSLVK